MIDCPNRAGKSCTLLGITVTSFGCSLCREQWRSPTIPPTADAMTPFLVELKTGMPAPDWDESQPSRGFGDTIYRTLRRLGIRPRRRCDCKRRQRWLNRLLPYKL